MTFGEGDRVRLQRDRNPEGTVRGAEFDGKAYVRLDNGQAATFPVRDLQKLDADESKAWPPAGIETK